MAEVIAPNTPIAAQTIRTLPATPEADRRLLQRVELHRHELELAREIAQTKPSTVARSASLLVTLAMMEKTSRKNGKSDRSA